MAIETRPGPDVRCFCDQTCPQHRHSTREVWQILRAIREGLSLAHQQEYQHWKLLFELQGLAGDSEEALWSGSPLPAQFVQHELNTLGLKTEIAIKDRSPNPSHHFYHALEKHIEDWCATGETVAHPTEAVNDSSS